MEEFYKCLKSELDNLRRDITNLRTDFNRRMERLEDSHWINPERKRGEILLFITITVSFIPFIARIVGGIK